MKPPRIQWASTPDGIEVAYQVVGDGPIDIFFCPSIWPNLDVLWEDAHLARFFRRLASFSRLIIMNTRGTGISDAPPRGYVMVEDVATDIRSVLDAAGSERAALFAADAGGFHALLVAATFPDRVGALILLDCNATYRRDDDYPWGFPEAALDRFLDHTVSTWGTGESLRQLAPELYEDERFREAYARLDRLAQSPATVAAHARYTFGNFDVRGILSTIRAPTLVISHTNHAWIRLGQGRYLAEHIPGARYLEREGFFGLYWMHDVDWVLDEVQAFFTGARGVPDLDDRVLATVLFTDIVGSTERAAELGDRRWRQLLDDHDALMHREIERFRGRALKSTGDGVMATFDGPARAIRCALSINEAVHALGLEVRTGLHTGEVEQRGEDVGGIAVHIAARVMAQAGADEVLVSGAVPPLVAGSGLAFEDRGSHALKGVPGEWRLLSVKP